MAAPTYYQRALAQQATQPADAPAPAPYNNFTSGAEGLVKEMEKVDSEIAVCYEELRAIRQKKRQLEV